MGSQSSNVEQNEHKNESQEVKTDALYAIKKECQHIRTICEKNDNLKKLQLKLAILENKTFNKVKYSQTCGHYQISIQEEETKEGTKIKLVNDCKEKAPDSFPESDVFLCSEHSEEISEHLNAHITKLCDMKSQIDKIRKEGTESDLIIINSAHDSLKQIISSFKTGSINQKTTHPKYYWSLLMTKLLTVIKYLKVSQVKNKEVKLSLVVNLTKLLIFYRYVMNPIGADILAFIGTIIPCLTNILSTVPALIQALDDLANAITDSVIFGYAASFVNGLATAWENTYDGVKMFSAGVVTTAAGGVVPMVATQTVVTTATVATSTGVITLPITTVTAPTALATVAGGILTTGGAILCIGGLYLLYNQMNSGNGGQGGQQNQAQNIANQHVNQVLNNVQQLQNVNNVNNLQQMLDELENNN